MARTSDGRTCSIWDPAADRFCAVGAIWRAAYELTGDRETFPLVENAAEQVVASSGCKGPLQYVNDLAGHDFIVGMFRVAAGSLAS